MIGRILLYAGSVIIAGWGTAHLAVTKSILKDFGEFSLDNRTRWSNILSAYPFIPFGFLQRSSIDLPGLRPGKLFEKNKPGRNHILGQPLA